VNMGNVDRSSGGEVVWCFDESLKFVACLGSERPSGTFHRGICPRDQWTDEAFSFLRLRFVEEEIVHFRGKR
jgi:hypothetical protein